MKHLTRHSFKLLGLLTMGVVVAALNACDSAHLNGQVEMRAGNTRAQDPAGESGHVHSIRLMEAHILRSPEEPDWVEALNLK
jgi:hypothetical protein